MNRQSVVAGNPGKILIATMLCLTHFAVVEANDGPPNIVLMMADDLGYNDLSCYGSQRLRTPVLDGLAKQGIRLTHYHAGATVCTPSRMALLTGSYPVRLGWPGGVLGYKIRKQTGLATEVMTIAELFQAAGYRTGLFGKWHLGEEDLAPMHQGFEETYYIAYSNNQTRKLWRGEELAADPFDNRLLSEQFTREAVRFIDQHRNRPFLLYLPFTAPHFPAEAHPDWKGRSKNGAYGDVVEELDSRVGEILAAIERNSLSSRTIVVFTSDNGPEPGQRKFASAAPYRGLKWSALEGGTRVPCILRWPGRIPAGTRSEALIGAIDLLPTLASASGIPIERIMQNQGLDGVDVWKTLTGETQEAHQRTDLLHWSGWAMASAISSGQWKLYFGEDPRVSAHGERIAGIDKGPVLFNLVVDPGETDNVAAEHPDLVKELLERSRTQLRKIHDNTLRLGVVQSQKQTMPRPDSVKRWGRWLLPQ